MTQMVRAFKYPPILVPQIENLLLYYLIPYAGLTPLDTRLPVPTDKDDVTNGFIRIEAGDSHQVSLCAWDLDFLFHCYSKDENHAGWLSGQCGAYLGAATGQSVLGSYVERVVRILAGKRLSDPNVNLPRYRGAGTWRVQGTPLTGAQSSAVL